MKRSRRSCGVLAGLEALASAARRDGWASGSGGIGAVREQAAALGWAEVAARRGDPPVSVLRPAEPGAAHLADPPDIVMLVSSRPSPTPTLVWKAGPHAGEGRSGRA
jgi:hypothetical protein